MVIHDDKYGLTFGVVSVYFRALIWVVLVIVGIFGCWWVYFEWLWAVVVSVEYILGGGWWWWVVVGLFWLVVGRGELALGGGFILRIGGW